MNDELLNYFDGDELAAKAWHDKYKLKQDKNEKTPQQMHERLAHEFARMEYQFRDTEQIRARSGAGHYSELSDFGKAFYNANTGKSPKELQDLILTYFEKFKYIVPQGSVMAMLGNTYEIGSLSNCFVIGRPHDSYGGIMQKDEQLAQLMKRRGGVGVSLSTLRPTEAKVQNSAKTSTGVESFMGRYSNTTNEVAQGGRRGALMESIDCRHPDLMNFIKSKTDKTKITGANISVELRADFMEAVNNDEDYILRFPCDYELSKVDIDFNNLVIPYNEIISTATTIDNKPLHFKKVKAKEYWDAIINQAWLTGDPGLMFIDNHHDYSPESVYPQYRGITTNPCGEIFMQMYDACRLLAINYFSLVINPFSEEVRFDWSKLYEVAYFQQRLADDLVELELEYIVRILNKIASDPEPEEVKRVELELWQNIYNTARCSRRTGSGFTALADAIAAMGLAYDSDEAIDFAEGISKIKMQAELDCTIDLAILRGTFEGWEPLREYDFSMNEFKGLNPFYSELLINFPEQVSRMCKFGRRNVSWSTVAPTGTVSLMTQTTSGIEPLFMPFYTRRKKINSSDTNARVDFVDQNDVKWQEFPVVHDKLLDWAEENYTSDVRSKLQGFDSDILQQIFEMSPYYGSTANDIDWRKRLKMQAAIQKYTTHSISSTINLPNNCTVREIDEIYQEAFQMGLKGITVYRDGSKTGVLVSNKEKEGEFEYHEAPVRPQFLEAESYAIASEGKQYTVIIGLYENKPYEVFAFKDHTPTNAKGTIGKDEQGVYYFNVGTDKENGFNILENLTDKEGMVTRLISISLRYGANVTHIVEQLNKLDGNITSFSKAIARILSKYIPNNTKATGVKCLDCKSDMIIFEEGCQKCLNCGSSKCG